MDIIYGNKVITVKKKILLLLGLFLSVFIPIQTEATSNEATIIDSDGVLVHYDNLAKGRVEIPNGVIEIAHHAFQNCTSITNIIIPDSVTEIGNFAFDNCSSLESINLPDSINEIGYGAFNFCTSLKSIDLPDSITSISNFCFHECKNLENIKFTSMINEFGVSAFKGTKWLEYKRKENPLIVINSILIDGVTCKGRVNIPTGVIKIESNAFELSSITDLVLPDTIKVIDEDAFCYSKLVSINIPSSVTRIESGTFLECRKLKSIKLSETLTYIGSGAFSQCKSLTQIVIPPSVTSINSAFINCTSLEYITIPESMTRMEAVTFQGCVNLIRVTIPENTILEDNTFSQCNSKMIIYGFKNSSAQAYAIANNISFKVLALNKTKTEISINKTIKLEMNSMAKCKWSSSDKSIAKVNSSGIVTGIKKGTVKISAMLYGKKFTCLVTVK